MVATPIRRTVRLGIDPLERFNERQVLSTLIRVPSRKIRWATTAKSGERRVAAYDVENIHSEQTLLLTRYDRMGLSEPTGSCGR